MDDKKKVVTEEETKGAVSKETEEIMDFDEMRESKNSESGEKKESKKEAKKDGKKESKKDKKNSAKEEKEESKKDEKKDSAKEEKEESEKDEKKESEKDEKKDSKLSDQNDQTDFSEQEIITTQGVKPHKGKKILGIALGTVAALFLIVYIAGYIYFSGHFYKDATINGLLVSNMSKEQAKEIMDDFYSNYGLLLETIDGKQITIAGEDISMQISVRDEFDSCIQQQEPYIWFINMFKHHDYDIAADGTWDETALSTIYDSMGILDKKVMAAPKDAYVGVEDGKFIIVKEILGTTIDVNAFKKIVESNLASVQSAVNLMDAGCYKLPSIYESDEALQTEYEAKSKFSGNIIKLQMDDLTLEPGMELYDLVLEKKGDTYEVSKDLVKKYVEDLAKEYDTMETERTFTTSFGSKKVKVYGSAFGYQLNQEETINALYKALTAGKPSTVEAVFDSKGYTLQGENDIGNTYVEVNLSEQRVIAYKNGKKIAEGDCVSGKESVGHGTSIGLYAIQDKLSPTVLRGEKKTVTKTVTKKKKGKKVKVKETSTEYEYESPVTFWLQFNGGIGLHDAAGWRSQYGGSIYYYSGSHGCVNLPYDLAETLYKNFEIGDPVVVYFWDNENRK